MKKNIKIMIVIISMFLILPVKAMEMVSCGGLGDVPVKPLQFIGQIVIIMQIAVPILLIIMGMIDFFKAVTANESKKMDESGKLFVKRIIYGVLVFFIVAIVRFIFGLLGTSNDVFSCASYALGIDIRTENEKRLEKEQQKREDSMNKGASDAAANARAIRDQNAEEEQQKKEEAARRAAEDAAANAKAKKAQEENDKKKQTEEKDEATQAEEKDLTIYNQNLSTAKMCSKNCSSIIKNSGCSASAYSAAIYVLTNKKVDLVDVAHSLCENGGYICGGGGVGGTIVSNSKLKKKYGVSGASIPRNYTSFVAQLKKGRVVLVSVNNGSQNDRDGKTGFNATSNGHYILLAGYKSNGRILVYNPNANRNGGYRTKSDINKYVVNAKGTGAWYLKKD